MKPIKISQTVDVSGISLNGGRTGKEMHQDLIAEMSLIEARAATDPELKLMLDEHYQLGLQALLGDPATMQKHILFPKQSLPV